MSCSFRPRPAASASTFLPPTASCSWMQDGWERLPACLSACLSYCLSLSSNTISPHHSSFLPRCLSHTQTLSRARRPTRPASRTHACTNRLTNIHTYAQIDTFSQFHKLRSHSVSAPTPNFCTESGTRDTSGRSRLPYGPEEPSFRVSPHRCGHHGEFCL